MPKSGEFKFTISASLIRELAVSAPLDHAASFAELIKNAYDADAEWVRIEISTTGLPSFPGLHFKNRDVGYIKVEDNGKGMSGEEVRNKWLIFATSQKKRTEETELKRVQVGGRGMGRLGTIRLGHLVELFTSTGEESFHVAFDWEQFDERPIHEIPVFTEITSGGNRGTTLFIFPIKDQDIFSEEEHNKLLALLTNKIFPFIDRKSFRILWNFNGMETELGETFIKPSDHGLHFENVWLNMPPALIQEVVEFWDQNKMIRPGFSSEERAKQVVLIIRSNLTHKIVGVSTAMAVRFKQLNNNLFYYYRSIVLPEHRQPGLASKIILETRDFLETFSRQMKVTPCIGLLTFVENPRLQQAKREATWPASKMLYMGVDKEGRQVRVYYFSGVRI